MEVILDSNILIYAMAADADKLRAWVANQSVYISKITELEVLGYHKIKTTELKALSKVINEGHLITIDHKVIMLAITLRQQKSMSIGDSIVAATAVSENLTLATANTKDFQHIKIIRLINPLEL